MAYKDKNKQRENQKRYRQNHPEVMKARQHAEYEKHKEHYRLLQSVYRKTHKESVNKLNAKWQKDARTKYRHLVIQGYGGKCICCGECEELFLEIHHPNGGGRKDWARKGGNSYQMYRWISENNYPSGYELLCANCHTGTHRTLEGICPHKLK
jgi:hypothetical protein